MEIKEIFVYLTLIFFVGSMVYLTLTLDKEPHRKKST